MSYSVSYSGRKGDVGDSETHVIFITVSSLAISMSLRQQVSKLQTLLQAFDIALDLSCNVLETQSVQSIFLMVTSSVSFIAICCMLLVTATYYTYVSDLLLLDNQKVSNFSLVIIIQPDKISENHHIGWLCK